MNAPCQNALMPRRPRELRITSISIAPMMTPIAVPAPPARFAPPDHGGGDHLQLQPRADVRGDGTQPAGLHDAREPRRKGRQHADHNLHQPHRDAGHRGGLIVAADSEQIAHTVAYQHLGDALVALAADRVFFSSVRLSAARRYRQRIRMLPHRACVHFGSGGRGADRAGHANQACDGGHGHFAVERQTDRADTQDLCADDPRS